MHFHRPQMRWVHHLAVLQARFAGRKLVQLVQLVQLVAYRSTLRLTWLP